MKVGPNAASKFRVCRARSLRFFSVRPSLSSTNNAAPRLQASPNTSTALDENGGGCSVIYRQLVGCRGCYPPKELGVCSPAQPRCRRWCVPPANTRPASPPVLPWACGISACWHLVGRGAHTWRRPARAVCGSRLRLSPDHSEAAARTSPPPQLPTLRDRGTSPSAKARYIARRQGERRMHGCARSFHSCSSPR
jgi:hypothetical protein